MAHTIAREIRTGDVIRLNERSVKIIRTHHAPEGGVVLWGETSGGFATGAMWHEGSDMVVLADAITNAHGDTFTLIPVDGWTE
jgi:hypothetical protein